MKVDITRFIDKIPELFAPSIHDGQVFIAYLDEDTNTFTIQADNIIKASAMEGVEDSLLDRINALETIFNSVLDLKVQSQTLDGAIESEDVIDFDFASIHEDILNMKSEIAGLSAKVQGFSEIKEDFETLRMNFNTLQSSVQKIASEINPRIISETEYDLSS